MAEQFNPAEWVPVTQQQQAPAFDAKEWVSTGNAVDPKTPFAGLTSAQPLNKSDLEITDRFKMGLGNAQGNIDYLKAKGYDAKLNDKGDLVYRKKDDLLWRYADEKNSWGLTEMIADVAEAAPEIATFAAQTGAVALSSTLAGAGILASGAIAAGIGGAMKAASSSFGRYIGTYSDSPENQLKDIAVEAFVNGIGGGAGRALELGAKPTLRWLTGNLKNVADNVAAGGETTKNIATFLTKVGFGVPDDAAELIVTKAGKVSAALDDFPSSANSKTITEGLDLKNVEHTKRLVNYYTKGMDKIYQQDEKFILNAAEKTGLEFNPIEMADNLMTSIGPIFKWKVSGVDGLVDVAGKKTTTTFAPNASQALALAKNDVNKITIDLIPDHEISALMQKGIATDDDKLIALASLMSNETGRSQLHVGMNRVLPNILSLDKASGKAAAKSFMEFDKLFSGQMWDMRSTALRDGKDRLAGMFSKLNNDISNVFSAPLNKVSGDRFTAMNQAFSTMKHGLEPLEMAGKNYVKDKMSYAKLYNQMKANSTLGTARRDTLSSVDDIFAQRLPGLLKRIDSTTEAIDVNLAAKHFAPWINPSIAKYAVGVGGGIGLATGDPSAALGIGGMALLTSPRLAAKAFGAAAHGFQGANSHLAKQFAQFPEAIKGMQVVKGLMSNRATNAFQGANRGATAEVFSSLVNNYLMAPMQQQQTQQQLLQQGGVR